MPEQDYKADYLRLDAAIQDISNIVNENRLPKVPDEEIIKEVRKRLKELWPLPDEKETDE